MNDMNDMNDRWIWFIDDAPLQALLRAEGMGPDTARRSASSPALVRAISLHIEGRQREAIEELERASAAGDSNADIHGALGQLQFEAQSIEEAAQSYLKQTELDPGLATAHYNLGVCREKLGRWSEAAESFRRSLETDPARIEAALALGLAELHTKNPDRAALAFTRFLEIQPGHGQAEFGLAVAYQMLGRTEEADAVYRRSLERTPAAPELLVNLITLQVEVGNHAAAKEFSERLLAVRPKSRQGLEGLVMAAFGTGDYEEAGRHLLAITILHPDSFETWFNLGVARLELADAAGAADAFARAAKLNPAEPQARLGQGLSLERLGKIAEALDVYVSARLSTPLWNLALRLAAEGDGARAEQLHEKITILNPDAAESWFELGSLRLAANRWPEAVEAFAQCLRLKPNWQEAHFNLGISYLKQGALVDAAKAFDHVLEADAAHASALEAAASIAIQAAEPDRASNLHNRLLALGRSTPELAYNAALLLHNAGRHEDASALYAQALRQRPDFVEALVNLGHAAVSLGRMAESREHWKKAFELKPDLQAA